MRSVDAIMERCPLKHEIRRSLWERYARQIVKNRALRSYLTLYSPPMMDIKHFQKRGLLDLSDNVYRGVVAATPYDDAYHQAITSGRGRPELVIKADVNLLLVGARSLPRRDRQRFLERFPFEVVNLDYSDSIFWGANEHDVSLHLAALRKLVDLQRRNGADKFALFLTTTAELGTIASHFLDVLGERVATNLRFSRNFATKFHSLYQGQTPEELRNSHYDEFVPLGLAKFVTNLLTSNGFELVECETAVIQRPTKTPPRRMLHVACLVRMPPTVNLRGMGRQTHLERRIVDYLDKREKGKLIHLDEKSDSRQLKKQHGTYIEQLATDTFELQVPSPEDE